MAVKQLNVTLPEADLLRIKKDAISLGISLSDYAAIAFSHFLSKPIASRRVNAETVKPKTAGRKVSL